MGIEQKVTVIEAAAYSWAPGEVYISNFLGTELTLSTKKAKKFVKELNAAIEAAEKGEDK